MDRVVVPCNGCTACCHAKNFSVVKLVPAHGDDPSKYQTTIKDGLALARKENGECVYLERGGCSIRNKEPFQPWICRTFDCRKFYDTFSEEARHNLIRHGKISAEFFELMWQAKHR